LSGRAYVTREPHPTDRRATVATLTERGRAAAAQMVAAYRRTAKDLFAGLNPAEVATFVSTLETLLARLRTNVSG
jgi:DNA-binding MarR family transcriptional regulator